MPIETNLIPTYISLPPTDDFIKVEEIPFRNSFGYLVNCSVICDDINAEWVWVGITTVKTLNFTTNQFNLGPFKLAEGNTELNIKYDIPLPLGNTITFFAKNEHHLPVRFEIYTEVRYEGYRGF